jgi:hypothetical protein
MLTLAGGIVGLRDGARAAVPIAAVILAIVGGLFVLSLLVMLVVVGNRLRMTFSIDDRGIVTRVVDSRARAANHLAAMVGAVAGKPGIAGAGMIAMHDEERSVAWDGIKVMICDPQRRTITLRIGLRAVLYVFCTAATYEEAAALIASHVAGSRPP